MKRLLALLILPCAMMAFAQFPHGGPGIGGPGGFPTGPGVGGPGGFPTTPGFPTGPGIGGPGGPGGGGPSIGGPGGGRPNTSSYTRSHPYFGSGNKWRTPPIARGQWTHRRYAQPYTANPWILQNQRRFNYVAPTRGRTINLR